MIGKCSSGAFQIVSMKFRDTAQDETVALTKY
jgi:hypothetical protein